MDFLFELLAEIAGEVLTAVIDFFTFKYIFKDKKPTQKKSDVITRSILKRQAIKRAHGKGIHKRKIQNKKLQNKKLQNKRYKIKGKQSKSRKRGE